MVYLIYIFFGFMPSIVWLIFYLRKDKHPEPKRMILEVFFLGMLIALIAAVVEIGIKSFAVYFIRRNNLFHWFPFNLFLLKYLLYYIIGVGFIEEFLKYFVVKEKVLRNPEFDEPTDAIIYMIISALGFATLENIFFIISEQSAFNASQMIGTVLFRFITATFLHALCSGLIGFFIALSILKIKEKWLLLSFGLTAASILHGLYDFSIMKLNQQLSFFYAFAVIAILFALAIFLSFAFNKVKVMRSICEENKK